MKRRLVRCCRKLLGRWLGHYGISMLATHPQRTQTDFSRHEYRKGKGLGVPRKAPGWL
jgi:hypothetical protein